MSNILAIYKYPLKGEETEIDLQKDFTMLDICEFMNKIYISAIVNTTEEKVETIIVTAIRSGLKRDPWFFTKNTYLGTAKTRQKAYGNEKQIIWHIFWRKKNENKKPEG